MRIYAALAITAVSYALALVWVVSLLIGGAR